MRPFIMKKLLTALVGLFLLCVSQHSFAKTHQSPLPPMLVYKEYQLLQPNYKEPFIEAFYAKYGNIQTKAGFDLVHSEQYKTDHAEVVRLLSNAYQAYFEGKNTSVPNPSFLGAEDSAEHEWMPALYEVAIFLIEIENTAENPLPPELAIYLNMLKQHYDVVNKNYELVCNTENFDQDAYFTDRQNAWHYTHLHNMGDGVLGLIRHTDFLVENGYLSEGSGQNIKYHLDRKYPELANEVFGQSDFGLFLGLFAVFLIFGAMMYKFSKEQEKSSGLLM